MAKKLEKFGGTSLDDFLKQQGLSMNDFDKLSHSKINTNKLSVTKKDLLEWEDENEEDVFIDGPWNFNDDKAQIFIDRLNAEFNNDFSPATNKYDLNIHDVIDRWSNKKRKKVYEIFAYFLNEFGY